MILSENSNSIIEILSRHFLFSECSREILDLVSEECSIRAFNGGEGIIDEGEKHCLYIILSGTAAVYTKDENRDFMLRTVSKGDTLGVANLFVEEPFVSRVIALNNMKLMTVSEDAVSQLIKCDGGVAMKYILFLSDRIRFLNRRIAILSAGSAERRLAAWLDASCPRDADSLVVQISMSALADALGLGRASLYRAFDELSDKGYIKRKKNQVIFIDRQGMLTSLSLS